MALAAEAHAADTPAQANWVLGETSLHAGAAVFVKRDRRLLVRRGERIADSPWVLDTIDSSQVWLLAREPQTGQQVRQALRGQQPLPPPPAVAQFGVGAIETPAVQQLDETDGQR